MHKVFKRFLASAVLACFPLVISACGSIGGGAVENVEMTTISGIAIKGPIKGALVQIFKLNSDGSTGELLGSGVSGSDAKYSIQIPKAKSVPPLLVKVSGLPGSTYLSESTGTEIPFTPAESFNAALDTFDTTKSYTVSPLTNAAYEQLQAYFTDNPSALADTRLVSLANTRVASLFNVSDILAAPTAGSSYTAALTIIDQMVVNSGTSTTTQTTEQMNQALLDVNSKPYLQYQAALTNAATTVATNDPTVATTVTAIVGTVANPIAAPNWTDTTPPTTVSGLKAVAAADTVSTSSVALTWNAATTTGKNAVSGYEVYRNGVKITSVTALGYVDKPLVPATAYKYYVIAFDTAGNRSVASAEISATTPVAPDLNVSFGGQLDASITSAGVGTATPPVLVLGGLLSSNISTSDVAAPTTPSNLAATIAAVSATNSSVKLTWSASTDNVGVVGYEIYRDSTKIGTTLQLTFNDTSVSNGIASNYTIVAIDAAGNRSVASAVLPVTPIAPNLNVSVGGQLASSVTDAGVGVAIPAVVALGGQLTSDISTRDVSPPSSPANVAATATAVTATISSVKLTWSASTDNVAVTGYDVYRGATKVGTTSQRTFTDSAVTSGLSYNYTIVAFDAAGNSSAGSTAVTVDVVSPALIINVGGQVL